MLPTKSPTPIHMCTSRKKFNVTKQALISSIDEHCYESDDESEGSEN